MITRRIIKAVSITQSNRQAGHGNRFNQRNKRRHADKRRRQFLRQALRRDIEDGHQSQDPGCKECVGVCTECPALHECRGDSMV